MALQLTPRLARITCTFLLFLAYIFLPIRVHASDDNVKNAIIVCSVKASVYADIGNFRCIEKQLEAKKFLSTLFFPIGSNDYRILSGCARASYLGKVDDKAIYDDFLTAECFRVEICSCSECISPKTLPCNSKYYIASSGDRLIDAAISGDANLVERLLCSGANVNYNKTNFKNPGGATPLHFAASRNHSSVAVVLLKNGANVNATDNTGETPLAWAAGEDADDVINVLIESGARLTLHTAAQLGRFSDLRKLIERSGDINAKDRKAWTPLHHAADKCRVKVASFLIKEGALVKAETKHGYTPLHLAAASGCPEIAQFLIQGGASVNAKTDNLAPFVSAYSPLHSAVIHCETKYEKPKVPGGDVVVVKLLIEANADVNTKDSGGSTPLDDASTRKCRTIERLLLEHGARH